MRVVTKAKRGGKIARRWARGSTRRKPAPVTVSFSARAAAGRIRSIAATRLEPPSANGRAILVPSGPAVVAGTPPQSASLHLLAKPLDLALLAL